MPVTPNLNSSSWPFGLFQLTLGGGQNSMTNTAYYVETWDPQTVQTDVESPNEIGQTRAFASVIKHYTATALIAMPNTASIPRYGATGSVPIGYFPTGSTSTVTVRKVTPVVALEDFVKCNVEFISLVV